MRIAFGLLLLLPLTALATPYKISVPTVAAAGGNGNGNGNSGNGNGNGNGNSGSGNNNNSPQLFYSNSFISGRGSYQGGLLIGETLQSNSPLLQNSGNSSELQWVESLITGTLPTLPSDFLPTGDNLTGSTPGTYSYTLPEGVDYGYFMAKWGKSHNSSDHAVWFLNAGETLFFQLPNGLSHSKLWYEEEYVPPPPIDQIPTNPNPIIDHGNSVNVPDSGSTIILLFGTLLPLEILRRRRLAKSNLNF